MNKVHKILIILVLVIINISCDQISKNVVRHQVQYQEEISLIKNHFTLTRVENTGAFLSLGNSMSYPFRVLLLSLFPLLAIGFGIFYLITNNISKAYIIGLCFIIGGGIGNVFDRIRYGSVTDFLHLKFGLLQTGVFNLADVSVMTGIFILLFFSYLSRPAAN